MQISHPKHLWEHFKIAFAQTVDAKEQELVNAWANNPGKTTFYEKTLMPTIGGRLGLEFEIERLRCDYTFLNGDRVPLIAVESENSHPTAWREIECLCSLAAPLKILMLSCEWQASEKAKFLPVWIDIVRKHHALVSVACLYAIVVGEWQENKPHRIEYSFTLVEPNGNSTEDGSHPVVRQQSV